MLTGARLSRLEDDQCSTRSFLIGDVKGRFWRKTVVSNGPLWGRSGRSGIRAVCLNVVGADMRRWLSITVLLSPSLEVRADRPQAL